MNIDGPGFSARPAKISLPVSTEPKKPVAPFVRGRVAILNAALDFIAATVAMYASTLALCAVVPAASAIPCQRFILPLSLFLIASYAALSLYAVPGSGPCDRLRIRFLGTALMSAAAAIVLLMSSGLPVAIVWAILTGGLTLVLGVYTNAFVATWLAKHAGGGVPTAVIGTGDDARAVAAGLLAHPEIGLRPIGFIATPNQPSVGVELPLPLLCRLDNAALLEPGIEVAVVTSASPDRQEIEMRFGAMPFRHFTRIDDARALSALRLQPHAHIGAAFLVGSGQSHSHVRLLKRAIDIVLTLPFALLALPITLLAILAVKIVDPGKAIYVQSRVGLGGRRFGVYKIRTMYQDADQRLEQHLAADPVLAEQWKKSFKLENDPRILPGIGHFLRRSSLDELPQLWNVIGGDMSLVGPRPFPPYHLECFDKEFQERRQSVMPGLTGLWQITVRSDSDLAKQKEQDLLYIDNWSFWLDLKILLETPLAVIRGTGAK